MLFILIIGRIIDECIFFQYRNVRLKKPVFIISNPRNGTTYLHKLLHSDQEKYNSTLLYHTVFPCVCYIKLIQSISKMDQKIGQPIKFLVQKFEKKIFGTWKNIHPLGFDQTEEDEALFVFAGLSPASFILAPWIKSFKPIHFLDRLSEKEQLKIKTYYISSLQRIHYATQPDKTLLIKNVFSTSRLEFILDCFPDAKIIYPIRHPEKAVVSLVSMFSTVWEKHSPELQHDKSQHRELAKLAMDYYQYIFQKQTTLNPTQLYILQYEKLIENPRKSIVEIYRHFEWEISEAYSNQLKQTERRNKDYRSKHKYSAKEFGINPQKIHHELQDVIAHYWVREKTSAELNPA